MMQINESLVFSTTEQTYYWKGNSLTNDTQTIEENDNLSGNSTNDTSSVLYFIILRSLIGFLTMIGNIIVIVIILLDKKLKSPFNYYILNLAVTDLLVGVLVLPLYVIYEINSYWPLSDWLCNLWVWLDWAATIESIATLVAISIDRFWSVTWSIHYKSHHTNYTTMLTISLTWIYVNAVWLPLYINERINFTDFKTCYWDMQLNQYYVIYLAIFGYYVPLLIMVISYFRVFCVLQKGKHQFERRFGTFHFPVHQDSSFPKDPSSNSNIEISDDMPCKLLTHNLPKLSRSTRKIHSQNNLPPQQKMSLLGSTRIFNKSARLASPESPGNLPLKISLFKKERKVFITLGHIVIVFLICWIPWYIIFIPYAFKCNFANDTVMNICGLMGYMNSMLNPIVYNISSKAFRKSFKEKCLKLRNLIYK